MSIDQVTHSGYISILQTESEQLAAAIGRKVVQITAGEALREQATTNALEAYQYITQELRKIPEHVQRAISEENKEYGANGLNNPKILRARLSQIKDSIGISIEVATVQVVTIKRARENGVDIGDMLKSIQRHATLIQSECEKLLEDPK